MPALRHEAKRIVEAGFLTFRLNLGTTWFTGVKKNKNKIAIVVFFRTVAVFSHMVLFALSVQGVSKSV